jgi:predicted regulator of Ras-like GTPase activity (Roadblock/LC7/MglB family)
MGGPRTRRPPIFHATTPDTLPRVQQQTEKRPLILHEEDVAKLVAELESFQATTRTRANLLLDADGHSLVQVGDPRIPLETLGALVTASVAATRNVGTILGPDEFMSLTHTGKSASVQLTTIADGVLLASVLDQATTVAVVVFYMKPLRAALAGIVKEVRERKGGVDLGKGFKDTASRALDDMFGEEEGG